MTIANLKTLAASHPDTAVVLGLDPSTGILTVAPPVRNDAGSGPTWPMLLATVAATWGIGVRQLISHARPKVLTDARHALFAMSECLGLSASEVGRRTRHDHGSVCNGRARARVLMSVDAEFRRLFESAIASLGLERIWRRIA